MFVFAIPTSPTNAAGSTVNYVTDVLIPLGSALLGASVGAWATYWATNKALKQERSDATAERAARQKEASSTRTDYDYRLIRALSSEIEENILGQASKDSLVANFATDAWSRAREVSSTLPGDVYDPLQVAYAAAASFNSKWNWARSVTGVTGRYNETLRANADAVVHLFQVARSPLYNWLDDLHTDGEVSR
jgi:hypothetical protein